MSSDLDREVVFPRRRRKHKRAPLSYVLRVLIKLAEQHNANPLLVVEARAWLAWATASESVAARATEGK